MNQLGEYGMGSPPYTYFLNGVQQGSPTINTHKTFTGLTSGYYNVGIQDSDLNFILHTIFVNQSKLSANISTVAETLQDGNGSITINSISGGIGPYTATINSSTPVTILPGYVFNNLSAGNYLIEITDSVGCYFNVKPIVRRIIPPEENQKISGNKTPIFNPTIYEKRLGGFKLINKKQ
jgi:hypothetical protein